MSTTTKNTLFDISCKDPVLQKEIFDKLCALDILQSNPISVSYRRYDQNKFIEYGQGYYAILKAIDDLEKSTNPIHISNGLFSEFYILMDNLSHATECNQPVVAYRYFVNEALKSQRCVRVIHLSFHINNPGQQMFRSMSLASMENGVDGKNPNEIWITFETIDVDVVTKKIIDYMQQSEMCT